MISSGILNLYDSHTYFMYALALLLWHPENNDTRKKLTLIDVAPAFLLLLSGYLLSFACFIGEMLIGRKKKSNLFTRTRTQKVGKSLKLHSV